MAKFKCPIDGNEFDEPGMCPEHPDTELVEVQEGEEGTEGGMTEEGTEEGGAPEEEKTEE